MQDAKGSRSKDMLTSSGKTNSKHVEFESSNLQWIKLVIEFFELHFMAIIERKKAIRIERFFCNIRRQKIRATFNEYIYKTQGFSMSMEKLPRGVSLKILGYLSKRENLSIVSGLSKRYRNLA